MYTATRSKRSDTVPKRSVTHAPEFRKSQQAKQFFKLVSQLRESDKPVQRRLLKKKLARITFGE
jgi:hypothetical protein